AECEADECFLFLYLCWLVISELPSGPHGCAGGSCYPATGNLLIGRDINLTATSTCGLEAPEQYCIVSHLLEVDKCFKCDSRRPYQPDYHRTSHRVENVIYLKDSKGDLTWWQSVNGEESVSIRLNLEAEFHFTHLIMKFKTFRPAGMLIERSADFGRSWRPYRYFAYNCSRTFPQIPSRSLQLIDDVICEERYSDIEPSTEGEVIYKVLDPSIHVSDPYSTNIQDLLRITNLRINFTKLHTLGDNLLDRRPDVLQKYYYALYELVVRGSCFCYGHASECVPVQGVDTRVSGMIHGHCVCKHNTEGLNCERCRDFHHDLPWRPAEADNPHTCRECNCNGHSDKCHFDMAVYLATGNVSGGVCDDCLHNTMGRNCETCKPFYYQDPARDIRDPVACVSCDCDPVGSLEGGVCDSHTDLDLGMIGGQCRCKPNVKGQRCDYCKEGHYGLSQNDPLGCQPCNCDPRGITMVGGPCDPISGDCSCKRYVTGRYCNQCIPEFWGLSNDLSGCRPCDCDFGGAYSNKCRMDNGQCDCRPHLISRQCSDVQPEYFCAALDFYKYEAEGPDVMTVHRERQPGQMVTWTGPGFARVKDGAGLVFTIDNIAYAMEYDIMIRYEPEVTCHCDPQGSLSAECDKVGGQCHCKPNVIGRNCNLCAPRTYGFGPYGCTACDCHLDGSAGQQCDPSTGQCPCNAGAHGRQCSNCQHGHWGFPNCRPCQCNGHAESCDPHTGACHECRDHTAGHQCERCMDGFYGNPVLGSGEHCRPCPCPGYLDSGHSNGDSCHMDPASNQIICHCKQGYTGPRCDQCAPGFYGNPEQAGGECRPCECNGNIVAEDPGSCDQHTGQCLKCLYNTDGLSCSECKPGYYGNALVRDCRRCTCMTLGTQQAYCSDGLCYCDKQTGLCPCRTNVEGRNCDQCASNYWNLGMDRGCEACGCHPQNSLSPHCNLISGQCHCRPGFGGQQCTECEPLHWGNPNVQCAECRCDPLGAEALQCDRTTGACLCREGTSGRHCDECARGFTGSFPKCVSCHPCFQLWDDIVCQVQRDLDNIRLIIAKILEMGTVPGVSDARIPFGMLNSIEVTVTLFWLRAEIAITDGRLMGIEREINGTAEQDNSLKRNLTSMEQDSENVDVPSVCLCADQFEKVRKYYLQSLEAEQRCNASVFGPESPVEQSQDTRNRTETLLEQKKDQLLRTVTAQNKSLSELEKKANDLNNKVHHLSHKVCGGSGNVGANDTCADNSCGGTGCKDSNGTLLCGGPKCKGTVGDSLRALQNAHEVTKNLTAASDDLMNIEEGADPESIEKVAKQVLAIELPVNRTLLDRVVQQIRDNIANLTDVERIFNQTSAHLDMAKQLLNRAQNAGAQADRVGDAISKTKEAMNTSQEAIEKAEKAIEMAMENLDATKNATAMV
uniref:Laminin, beta 1b n=1 Tax=Pygocentrus nattereri TaxID=42514 RepID=A0AAR2LWX9_PYGNA